MGGWVGGWNSLFYRLAKGVNRLIVAISAANDTKYERNVGIGVGDANELMI